MPLRIHVPYRRRQTHPIPHHLCGSMCPKMRSAPTNEMPELSELSRGRSRRSRRGPQTSPQTSRPTSPQTSPILPAFPSLLHPIEFNVEQLRAAGHAPRAFKATCPKGILLAVWKNGIAAGRLYHTINLRTADMESGFLRELEKVICHLVPVCGSVQAAIDLLYYQTGTNAAGIGIRVRNGKMLINTRWLGRKLRILANQ